MIDVLTSKYVPNIAEVNAFLKRLKSLTPEQWRSGVASAWVTMDTQASENAWWHLVEVNQRAMQQPATSGRAMAALLLADSARRLAREAIPITERQAMDTVLGGDYLDVVEPYATGLKRRFKIGGVVGHRLAGEFEIQEIDPAGGGGYP